ncbi:MAG: putative sulfate exporter family transporter [Flavobacteriales bacterium]|nr:putative sulfate exporter family transporter [Flavobacteriales bacterium]
MQNFKTKIPGLLASLAIAVMAVIASTVVSSVGAILMALILGAVIGNLGLNTRVLNSGLKFVEKTILELAIVLIGFGFDGKHLSELRVELMISLVVVVTMVLFLSILLGRLFKVDKKLSILLGVGNAICGSAAIAAIAPFLKSDEKDIGLSLGVINLLGVIGLALLPGLSYLLCFSDFETGVLIGGTLQAIGHVAASSFSMGDTIGSWAMVVKMGRVFLLIPLLVVMYFIGRKKSEVVGRFPWFILAFAAAVYVAQTGFFPDSFMKGLAAAGDFALALAMAAIGIGIRVKPLLNVSAKGIALGTALFGLQILMIVGLVYSLRQLG